MAKLCTQCGKPLPRDDARFCNNCGALIPSSPARSTLASPRTRLVSQESETGPQPILREQIAFPPQQPRVEAPPSRELRIKVWEDIETRELVHPHPDEHGEVQAGAGYAAEEQNQVEDRPTSPLTSATFPGQQSKPSSSIPQRDFTSPRQTKPVDDVDDLPTRPMIAAQPQQWPTGRPVEQRGQAFPSQPEPHPVVQRPVTPAVSIPQAGFQPAPAGTAAPLAPVGSTVPPVARPARRTSKRRLGIILVLLLLLAVGGVATWIIVFQPFTVPDITRTTESFQSTDLAIALQYPRGWTAQVDQPHSAAYFYDANHTNQVNILAVANSGQSINQYIKKEESQLGMATPKSQSSLTFAGATWQQVQGTALQSGATYTETLLVTVHGGRFYAIVQMAPAPTYVDAERLFFAPLRSTLQFQ